MYDFWENTKSFFFNFTINDISFLLFSFQLRIAFCQSLKNLSLHNLNKYLIRNITLWQQIYLLSLRPFCDFKFALVDGELIWDANDGAGDCAGGGPIVAKGLCWGVGGAKWGCGLIT